MDAADAEWATSECLHAIRGLYEFVPFGRWVSHPSSTQRASSKLIRVTVIGDDVFAAEIDPSISPAAEVDFRVADVFDLKHRVVDLPKDLQMACAGLLRRLDLAFGAIDLIRDADGTYYFLEINPNGQWMWIGWVTGLPIRDSLCRRLSLHLT